MRPIPILALCLLAACGGSDPKTLTDEGARALNSGDPKGALSRFEEAIGMLQPEDPDFLRASVGRCQALARTQPDRAKTEFLALAAAHPSRVLEPEFVAVADELASQGAIGPATEVAEAGIQRFPESPAMVGLRDRIGDAAKSANDPESLQKLKGLGYAGDG